MQNKFVLFWQPAGMGDILYLQKAAQHFLDLGYRVVWPVIPEFLYVKDYIPHIEFCDVNNHFDGFEYYGRSDIIKTDEMIYFPLHHAHLFLDNNYRSSAMRAKYPLFQKLGYSIESSDWVNYLNFKRNPEREKRCKEILGIEDGEEFIFINDMFASPPNIHRREMHIETSLKKVYHKIEHINQFNLFDLCWVLENAKEIHTVETSMCYLVERINKNSKLFMYSRRINGQNQHIDFSYVSHIYKKEWNYIL
jgi:hypothetical protein